MAVLISQKVLDKLASKHQVSAAEVQQCFENRTGDLLQDDREEHRTDPPTMWFVAPTNKLRLLKVCFIQLADGSHVRTCYPANDVELRIYRTHGRPSDF